MSLDVYVQPEFEIPQIGGEYEYICYFTSEEGYYWFLYPLFEELVEETGQFIDLYGVAAFSGVMLDTLAQTIAKAQELVAAQSDSWEVITGVQTMPVHKVLRSTVYKQQMQKLLAKLEDAINKAKKTDTFVTFWGD